MMNRAVVNDHRLKHSGAALDMTGLMQLIARWKQKIGSSVLIVVAASAVTGAILALVVPALETRLAGKYSVDFMDGYAQIARTLAEGGGYRWEATMGETMVREPGYPMLLAGAFIVFGSHIETARFLNWLFALAAAFMIMRLAQITTGNAGAALAASLLFLLHPGTLIAEARGGVEVLFLLAALAFVLVLQQAVEKRSCWRYFLAGTALGIVVQIRSTPLIFPVVLLSYLLIAADNGRERLRALCNVTVLALGTAIVMAPWVIRNYTLVHAFVPGATIAGVSLQAGQYRCMHLPFGGDAYQVERAAGGPRAELARELGLLFEGPEYSQVFYDAHDEWVFNRALIQRAQGEYLRNPSLLASCVGKNLFNFWFLGKTWKITKLNMLVQCPFLVAALGGLLLLWRWGLIRKMGITLAFIASILLVHLPVISAARYSVPVIAFLAIPAGVSITFIWSTFRKGSPAGPPEPWRR